mmetsp:Transcript_23430/g.42049  ORF Transcript_23430/g.42049 Transcript_23430/m.42049 type:complete len:88 (-) Transcript_23430:1042-1305(-)
MYKSNFRKNDRNSSITSEKRPSYFTSPPPSPSSKLSPPPKRVTNDGCYGVVHLRLAVPDVACLTCPPSRPAFSKHIPPTLLFRDVHT